MLTWPCFLDAVPEQTLQHALRCNDMAFVRFLEGCLRWDPKQRFTPDEALQHGTAQLSCCWLAPSSRSTHSFAVHLQQRSSASEWILEGTVPVKHLRPHHSTESSSSHSRRHKHRHHKRRHRRHHARKSKDDGHHQGGVSHNGDSNARHTRTTRTTKHRGSSQTYGMSIAPLIWGSSAAAGAAGAGAHTGVRTTGTHHTTATNQDAGGQDSFLAPAMGAIEMKVRPVLVRCWWLSVLCVLTQLLFQRFCSMPLRLCFRLSILVASAIGSAQNQDLTHMLWVDHGACAISGTTHTPPTVAATGTMDRRSGDPTDTAVCRLWDSAMVLKSARKSARPRP